MAHAISTPMLSRRALVFLGIVALHVGFVYVLNAGLATQAVEVIFGPIETKMIEEVKDEKDKPPPPPPKIETAPPPFVPPPDIAIDLPVETSRDDGDYRDDPEAGREAAAASCQVHQGSATPESQAAPGRLPKRTTRRSPSGLGEEGVYDLPSLRTARMEASAMCRSQAAVVSRALTKQRSAS